jgi:tRNA (guanine37-N1)-methyltransferase
VPEVLRSGHAANILRWRREQSLLRTWLRRPDLLQTAELSEKDKTFLAALAESE